MRFTIYLIILIVISSFTYGAYFSVTMNISVSHNGGTNYTGIVGQLFLCDSDVIDWTKTFYLDGETPYNWMGSDVTNDSFRARYITENIIGASNPQMDNIRVQIEYVTKPTVTIKNPTPNNNSYATNSFYVNASSDFVAYRCMASHNSTGRWVNYSLTAYPDGLGCEGYLYNLVNKTQTYYEIIVVSDDTGNSPLRYINVNSTAPSINITSPLANETFDNTNIPFNWSIQDYDNDLMEYRIFAGKNLTDINSLFPLFIRTTRNATNSTIIDHIPLTPNFTDMYAFYHLNNDANYNEYFGFIYDNSAHGRNGTWDVLSTAKPSLTAGKFGYGYQFASYYDSFILGSYNTYLWNETCINGCSVSAWGKLTQTKTSGTTFIFSKYKTPNDKLLALGVTSSGYVGNIPFFSIDQDGTSPVCTAANSSLTLNNNINEWVHYVGIYNKTANLTLLYINGYLQDTDYCPFSTITQSQWNVNINTRIGGDDTFGNEWIGGIDEVAIWNRTLSPDEVVSLHGLTEGRYFYNITTADWNIISNGNFSINMTVPPINCVFNCSTDSITGNIDCNETDFVVDNIGTLDIKYNVSNINRIIGNGCLIALKNGSELR